MYANEPTKVSFDNLHCEQDQIEKYLYKLTCALDNEARVYLLGTYTRFRMWYVPRYYFILRNSVKGKA
jgi:hypothetical protein